MLQIVDGILNANFTNRYFTFLLSMDLILITSPLLIRNEHELLMQFFELGLETLHVRKPDFTFGQLKDWLQEIPMQFHNRLMLHSHHELNHELQIKGLHFPSSLRLNAKETGKGSLQFSTSFHQVQEILNPSPIFDYAFLSPIFDSISKAGYKADFSETELKNILPAAAYPVIALGGITSENLEKVAELGFNGAAVLGAVWQADDPVSAFKSLKAKISEL
jgi:thiamine-phosphate pyrophosphorylase